MAGEPEFAAFLSYVRADDEHEGGGITALARALEGEVRMQLGRSFEIFVDKDDIAWGQRWKRRIDDTLDAATLLIPVITPAFFARPECRREVERFLEREQELGRDELIFPIQYVLASGAGPLAVELAARQRADWRELRFEPLTAPVVRKRLAELAGKIIDAMQRPPSARSSSAEEASSSQPSAGAADERSANEPDTCIVDPLGRAGPTTIVDAIARSGPGTRILVRPGLYDAPLVVDHPLEIMGQGPRDEIIVRVSEGHVLTFGASFGRVSNLTLHQVGGGSMTDAGVHVEQGRLELEECDIRSVRGAGIYIRGGADPRVRRNLVHDCGGAGALVEAQALGTFEDNDIARNALAAVEVRSGADPTLRRNRLRESRSGGGLFVHSEARGTYEDNDITDNAFAGVEVKTAANPTVRGNRIVSRQAGIYVSQDGRGTFEENTITSEIEPEWNIADDCADNVTVRGNTPEWTRS